mmetsp:Transcript_19666/g.63915  ORF Transcript_19666/g.63915 Transcript_19666/m.63915 type:complete len:91 (+) Transcript_19666:212-484(+)
MDLDAEAASAHRGGFFAPKPRAWTECRLGVEDPLVPGRELAAGSHAIKLVQSRCAWAERTLRDTNRLSAALQKPPDEALPSLAQAEQMLL